MLVTPIIGGAIVGLLAVACPLTLGDGSLQLGVILDGRETLGVDTLIVSALVKLIAAGISHGFGFIGGDIFPYVFAGACIGATANVLFPDSIPVLVSYSVCMAAVPSTLMPMVLTLTSLASMALALGGFATSPVFIASMIAYTVGPGFGLPQWLVNKALSRKNKQ
jgi:H+/Cl- antiporter ClcA